MVSDRLKKVILAQLKLDEWDIQDDTTAGTVPGWDSLSHVGIISAVEDAYKVRFKTQDRPAQERRPAAGAGGQEDRLAVLRGALAPSFRRPLPRGPAPPASGPFAERASPSAMTFTSIRFAPFLLGVLALSLLAGRRWRWLVLLVASYAFYASLAVPYLLAVLAGVTLASYSCARLMEKEARPERRRALLWLGLAVSLGALGVLKYVGFAAENLNALGGALGLHLGLPTGALFASIGVSYYALQAVSYLLDVHDEAVPAERHLGRFALYLAFFPKVVQGPIERAEALLPQLAEPRRLGLADLAVGAQLILWGLFQKVVVADALAPFVQVVYGDVHRHEGVAVLVATYLFAAQLYFDFAGYTDMAIGVARLFGLRLSPNFRSPYLSTSVSEFWRRWHISFSSLLLDYVFRPLQIVLRDYRTWGTPLALLATFLVSGLWHGATWGFVAWGLLHGLFLGAAMLARPFQQRWQKATGVGGTRLYTALQVLATFHLVCLAWISSAPPRSPTPRSRPAISSPACPPRSPGSRAART